MAKASPVQIESMNCRGPSVALLQVQTAVSTLAKIHSYNIQHWEEPGLGPQLGFNVVLSNGVGIHLEEFSLKPDFGITVHADSFDINSNNLDNVIDCCLAELFAPESVVMWRQAKENLQIA
jgi:hypothetical protein